MDKPTDSLVVLAGAGPGDADLITLKLQKRIAEANVIITDRLVNPDMIKLHARPDVIVLLAGKQGYNDASYSQDEINQLLIQYAAQYKRVVRLKGGDVAFFSNVLDELETLKQHKIPYEIIPGITAASGASAYAAIPLTARGYAQGVQFLTFNPNSAYSEEQWKALASTSDTLVCYMASRNLMTLIESLLIFGCQPSTPIAVVEQATTGSQKIYTSTLEQSKTGFADQQFLSPSLVIIGEVVRLHEQYRWFTGDKADVVFEEI
ncbi:MAG TPA: uroporphyrinogen-III C-methyltransferase [Lacibacter sp.]|nr:uroporphyrinogen-III C-methyltransferase [Lacibacter sp.]HMO87767.1 uroporphyrinogen-III C-methyltransferase [Lacibacter sp.]HMP85695.1 uroporphyrinogen-III C-methyltransferase [Lacibacter sp.]